MPRIFRNRPLALLPVGPGDIVPNAIAWWGDRAYSRSAIGRPVINLRRSSDDAQLDFIADATGRLNYTDITNWRDALGAATAFTTTLYDQTGNGWDLSNGTTTTQPVFSLDAGGRFFSTNWDTVNKFLFNGNGLPNNFNQPFTMSAVAARNALFTTAQALAIWNGNTDGFVYAASANTASWSLPTPGITFTILDGVYSPVQAVANGGPTSSTVFVANTFNTGDVGTDNGTNTNFFIGQSGGIGLRARVHEMGFWPIAFSQAQMLAMDSHQLKAWNL